MLQTKLSHAGITSHLLTSVMVGEVIGIVSNPSERPTRAESAEVAWGDIADPSSWWHSFGYVTIVFRVPEDLAE